jgi:hypothetical protein
VGVVFVALHEEILVCVCPDWFEAKDCRGGVEFFDLFELKSMYVGVDCNLLCE